MAQRPGQAAADEQQDVEAGAGKAGLTDDEQRADESQRDTAAFQQAGDFEVVSVNGQLQKNGGNVASYFCTSAGRVIHAVGKQVSPQRLLQEGEWAVDL